MHISEVVIIKWKDRLVSVTYDYDIVSCTKLVHHLITLLGLDVRNRGAAVVLPSAAASGITDTDMKSAGIGCRRKDPTWPLLLKFGAPPVR